MNNEQSVDGIRAAAFARGFVYVMMRALNTAADHPVNTPNWWIA